MNGRALRVYQAPSSDRSRASASALGPKVQLKSQRLSKHQRGNRGGERAVRGSEGPYIGVCSLITRPSSDIRKIEAQRSAIEGASDGLPWVTSCTYITSCACLPAGQAQRASTGRSSIGSNLCIVLKAVVAFSVLQITDCSLQYFDANLVRLIRHGSRFNRSSRHNSVICMTPL